MRPRALLLRSLLLAAALGCDNGAGDTVTDGGQGGAGGGAAGGQGSVTLDPLGEQIPAIASQVATYEAMADLIEGDLTAAQVGDPAALAGSEAIRPTAPGVIASLYYESEGFRQAVEQIRDRRPSVRQDDEAGGRIANAVALDFQLGFAGADVASIRGSADWHGRRAVRKLDAWLVMAFWSGLSERSADGFDRALALLWDETGEAVALGRHLAQVDGACGTNLLGEIRQALGGARGAFASALETKGLPDALDRLVIEEGDSPEYDEAILVAEARVHQGLALQMALALEADDPVSARGQATAMGIYLALSAKVLAKEGDGADTLISQGLDQMAPGAVQAPAIRATLESALDTPPCGD